ncbi:MAG: helix-turn-helix transcriptional regulator [Oscillospiraceae bacterium]|nr:helix-turn-helix transcriptional regulator [Oscillospiraceae bacterium]
MSKERQYYNFKALGQAIKSARTAAGMTRDELGEKLNLAPRYIVSIENEGQHPSLQVLYELVTLFNISVDQFFFKKKPEYSTLRRQVDGLLDSVSERDLPIIEATARGIIESRSDPEE